MSRFAQACFLIFLCSGIAAAPQDDLANLSTQQLQLFKLLNQERAKAGLPQLEWDDHLSKSASAHARLMAEKRELSHQFPDEPNLRERIGSTGLRFNAGAENVAYAPTIEELHAGLMKSPPHRANILDPKFNAVGIGIAPSGGDLYVAQNFARTVPSYTEDQFRDAVVGAFQKARLQSGAQKIAVESDVHLHDVACSQKPDPNAILASLPGATDLVVFTSSSPEKFPQQMSAAASDKTLNRMKIGACFQPGPEHGYASFQVVTAFYPK